MLIISQTPLKLIKNIILLVLAIIILFHIPVYGKTGKYTLISPKGETISLSLSLTPEEQSKGLSGLRPEKMSQQEGMLFVYNSVAPRQFWMPDTYFNLDIIFLAPDLKVIGIEKNVPAHPGLKEPPVIYRTKTYNAQYILETKAGSPFSGPLKIGDQLKWKGPSSLSEIRSGTHLLR